MRNKSSKPKANGAPVEEKAASQFCHRRVGRLVFAGYFFNVFTVLVAAHLIYTDLEAREQARRNADLAANTARMGKQLASNIGAYAAAVGVVSGEPSVVVALGAGQTGHMEAVERRLVRYLANVMSVRLLSTEPGNVSDPSFGYACLELAQRAGQGESPPVEAHSVDGGLHLDIVRPVTDGDGKILGSLMVTFGPKRLKSLLGVFAADEQGYFEVRQVGSGAPLTLASYGNKALKNRPPATAVPIPGTPWELTRWAEGAGGPGYERHLLVLGAPLGGSLILFALWSWFVARRVDRDTAWPIIGSAADGHAGRTAGITEGWDAKAGEPMPPARPLRETEPAGEIVFVDAEESLSTEKHARTSKRGEP